MPPPTDTIPHAGALPWVQVLRAAAALAVVFLHVTQQAGALAGAPGVAPYAWLRPLPWDAGVDVFFVISGFVMLWSSARLFGRTGGVRHFLGRRIARVVPLYWLLTSALVAGALLRPGWLSEPWSGDWLYVAASYAFLPYRRPDGFIQPVFRLGWTLNYEMMFYGLFALALRLRPAVAIPGVIGVLVALAGCGRVLRPAWTPAAFWTDSIVLEFALGVLLAAAALGGTRLPRLVRLLLAAVGLAGLAADATGFGIPRGVAWGLPSAALVGAAALGGAGGAGGRGRRAAERLGDASYALYLVHPFPMRLLQRLWPPGGLIWIVSYIAVATLLSLVLALAVHRWIERPLTNAARRVLVRPAAKAAGGA
jgi:peptidoglycan/LPS O-acetylase OafA/YrhL